MTYLSKFYTVRSGFRWRVYQTIEDEKSCHIIKDVICDTEGQAQVEDAINRANFWNDTDHITWMKDSLEDMALVEHYVRHLIKELKSVDDWLTIEIRRQAPIVIEQGGSSHRFRVSRPSGLEKDEERHRAHFEEVINRYELISFRSYSCVDEWDDRVFRGFIEVDIDLPQLRARYYGTTEEHTVEQSSDQI